MRTSSFSPDAIRVFAGAVLLLLFPGTIYIAVDKEGTAALSRPAQTDETPDVNHLVFEFTARETESRAAFGNYGYKCDLVAQTIKDGRVTGEYRRTTQVVLNGKGELEEKVVSFYPSSLTEIVLTREDLEDLSAKYQFTLETANASKYRFTYAGRGRVDDMDSYIFDVVPKSLLSRERLFSGRIWVRPNDLRILKTLGRGVQKGNQSFPVIESHRITVGDQFLFPSHAFADEELVFPNRQRVHLRMDVRYSEYVKLR